MRANRLLSLVPSSFAHASNICSTSRRVIPVATLTDNGYTDAVPFGLPGYTVVDLSASRQIGRSVQAFFGVQNLLNTVYFVQTNPSTIGTPRLVNGGVRIRWSGR